MNSGFKNCHPTVNILFYVSTAVFSMLFKHPLCVAVSLISSFACYLRLKGVRASATALKFILPMLIIVTLLNGLTANYGITPVFSLPLTGTVTFESLVYGLVLAVSVVSVILWMFCYNEVVTAEKFMHVFGKRLPSAALVVSMSLRFIPMYRERFRIIADAQRGIGCDYRTGSLIVRIRNAGKILSMLLTWALENAIETADSMRARGYGLKGRKTYSRFRFTKSDGILMGLIAISDVILAIAYFSGALTCSYNPYITFNPQSEPAFLINKLNVVIFPFSITGIVAVSAFTLLSFMPLLIDLKEEIKWYRLKLKI